MCYRRVHANAGRYPQAPRPSEAAVRVQHDLDDRVFQPARFRCRAQHANLAKSCLRFDRYSPTVPPGGRDPDAITWLGN